jgi:tetratricopeptide (TPR) repeat protein
MKKILIITAILNFNLYYAQENFKCMKIKGEVLVRKEFKEEFMQLNKDDILTIFDFIDLMEEGQLELYGNEKYYKLNGPLALHLQYLRDKTKNELAIFLAESLIMKNKKNGNIKPDDNNQIKTTSIYGSQNSKSKGQEIQYDGLAERKLNGAKYLFNLEYYNSSIIFALETFKLHPFLKKKSEDYLLFIDKLYELGFLEEALEEYQEAKKNASDVEIIKKIDKKILKIKNELE